MWPDPWGNECPGLPDCGESIVADGPDRAEAFLWADPGAIDREYGVDLCSEHLCNVLHE